ncbi:hypothetical protein [Psychrobacillus sp. L3]|uniref:hypothetical protein n=1 Tax=Psychrobacillus sp. L3 TaxID=3236891 RepID=UPI0036F28DDD
MTEDKKNEMDQTLTEGTSKEKKRHGPKDLEKKPTNLTSSTDQEVELKQDIGDKKEPPHKSGTDGSEKKEAGRKIENEKVDDAKKGDHKKDADSNDDKKETKDKKVEDDTKKDADSHKKNKEDKKKIGHKKDSSEKKKGRS